MDTIFALATAVGRAGVAVIRISGPHADHVFEIFSIKQPQVRKASLRRLIGQDGMVLDDALVLKFEAPQSFTGEDVVELHLHGGVAVVNAVISELEASTDLRLAEPGEFTRRAMLNGKLDLAEVEGLADLIQAETEAQRRQARRLFSGELGAQVDVWREKLVRAVSLLEAGLDFADEDLPEDVTDEVDDILSDLIRTFTKEVEGVQIAERVRDGFEVAIVGAPNVGKSTLLNTISGRDVAITSDHAGTTRDILEVRLDLNGIPVTLLDTAGLRESEDEIESIGIDRALARAQSSDVRIFLIEEGGSFPFEAQEGDVVAVAKGDLSSCDAFRVSGKTGLGVQTLLDRLYSVLSSRVSCVGLASRNRHAQVLKAAIEPLSFSRDLLKRGEDSFDLAAEEVRIALRALESLTGHVGVDDILDVVFSTFCLGK